MTYTVLSFVTLVALSGTFSTTCAQAQGSIDSLPRSFTVGSTQVVSGYVRMTIPTLDLRIAAAGLPRVGGSTVGMGVSSDIRLGRVLVGAGFQTLIPRRHTDSAHATRMSGSFALADVGYALVIRNQWSLYALTGVGLSHLSLSVRHRGDFRFDDALDEPSRQVELSGTSAMVHTGLLIEHRFRHRGFEYAVTLRGGMSHSIGHQRWLADESKVKDGPSGVRASYIRLAFVKPIRRRADGARHLAATVVQTVVR